MTLALFLSLCATLPQGPGQGPELAWEDRSALAFPADVKAEKVLPFGAGATPATVTTAAAGFADLDGDGIPDAWFLGAAGAPGKLSLQQGKNSAPGRFRDFSYGPLASVTDPAWVHGTSYRSSWYGTRQRVLLVAPTVDKLANLFFNRTNPNDPTQGSIVVDPAGWTIPFGSYEVAARDRDGNGHDDVALLTAIPGGTEVRKLVIGAPNYYLTPVYEVVGQVPLALSRLRCIDYDGDGRDDVAAFAPGVGIVILRDDGQHHFVPALVLPIASGLVDLQVGDLDRDGREDLVLTSADLVAAVLMKGIGTKVLVGERLAGSARFASARILDGDADGKPDVIAIAEDARSVTVYGYDGRASGFAKPRLLAPTAAQLADYPATNSLGVATVVGDVDNDGDLDLLLQLGGGKSWALLRSPTLCFAPREVPVVHLGPISSGASLFKEQLAAQMPPDWNQDVWDQLEVAYYMQDVLDRSKYVLRATQIVPLDGTKTRIDLPVWYERDPAKQLLVQNSAPTYLGLPYLAGDVVVFVHGKHSESVQYGRPPRRFESLILHHQIGGDEQTSNQGVKWVASKAPPLLATDHVFLPWQ